MAGIGGGWEKSIMGSGRGLDMGVEKAVVVDWGLSDTLLSFFRPLFFVLV